MRTPRKRQAEREVFIGTPERDPEPRSSRVRQVHSFSEVQGMPSMPSMPVGMRGSSSVPVGSPLINAPWISTQGGTTFGVTPEVWQWQQMQQQSIPQQPVRPQPDPLIDVPAGAVAAECLDDAAPSWPQFRHFIGLGQSRLRWFGSPQFQHPVGFFDGLGLVDLPRPRSLPLPRSPRSPRSLLEVRPLSPPRDSRLPCRDPLAVLRC